mgnify:CR=1 FL=1
MKTCAAILVETGKPLIVADIDIPPLQQRIVGQQMFQFLVQLQRGQLQQADRLLQLRREREVLGSPKL